MRAVKSTEELNGAMTNCGTRAGNLLRARVDVDRSAHKQILLERMNRRAEIQVRLQKTLKVFLLWSSVIRQFC